jgi:hypothetical protein
MRLRRGSRLGRCESLVAHELGAERALGPVLIELNRCAVEHFAPPSDPLDGSP